MPMLKVVTPFTVNMEPFDAEGNPRDPALPATYVFPAPGTYDATDEVAQHWFTAPHLEGYEPLPPGSVGGTEVMQPVPEEPPPDTVTGAARRQQQPPAQQRQPSSD